MTTNTPTKTKKRLPLLTILAGLIGLALVLTVSGFAYAASQESHDQFCASCHTEPESTFFQRSTAAAAVDVASYHTTQNVLCIDCHSGAGLAGRLQAELVGARNATKWYTGRAVQPAPLLYPIQDENCLKCHQNVTQKGYVAKQAIIVSGLRQERGGENKANHWHEFMTKWQAADANAGRCTSCHTGHTTGGTAQSGFLEAATTKTVCENCHRAIRKED